MNNINTVMVEGNIVDNAVMERVGSSVIAKFTLAVERTFVKKNEKTKYTSFFDVECWNDIAETAEKFAFKGRGARISGRLHQQRWTSQPDNKNRQKIVIIAENINYRSWNKDGTPETDPDEKAMLAAIAAMGGE